MGIWVAVTLYQLFIRGSYIHAMHLCSYFKVVSDCHMKISRSLKRRAILKIRSTIFLGTKDIFLLDLKSDSHLPKKFVLFASMRAL